LWINDGICIKKINLNGNNNESCGYYLYISSGNLYSQAGDKGKSYTNYDLTVGVIYSAEYNKKKKTITFYKNGENLGVAFANVDKKVELFPAFDFYNNGSTIEFVKFKNKVKKK